MKKINKEKQIAMPQKLLRELFNYSKLTGGLSWIKKPHPKAAKVKIGKAAGYVNKKGYIIITINGYNYYAHRLVWAYVHGDYPDGEQPLIDHINGNKGDNRLGNLRLVTSQENSQNRRKTKSTKSRFFGVTWHKRDGYWQASYLDQNRQLVYIGSFKPAEEIKAARAAENKVRSIKMEMFNEYESVNSILIREIQKM